MEIIWANPRSRQGFILLCLANHFRLHRLGNGTSLIIFLKLSHTLVKRNSYLGIVFLLPGSFSLSRAHTKCGKNIRFAFNLRQRKLGKDTSSYLKTCRAHWIENNGFVTPHISFDYSMHPQHITFERYFQMLWIGDVSKPWSLRYHKQCSARWSSAVLLVPFSHITHAFNRCCRTSAAVIFFLMFPNASSNSLFFDSLSRSSEVM